MNKQQHRQQTTTTTTTGKQTQLRLVIDLCNLIFISYIIIIIIIVIEERERQIARCLSFHVDVVDIAVDELL